MGIAVFLKTLKDFIFGNIDIIGFSVTLCPNNQAHLRRGISRQALINQIT